jgi:hypothetical protein
MPSTQKLYSVAGAALALAVCGAQPAAAQGSIQPCALLTQAQVSAALGVGVDAGQAIGTTGCQWSPPKQPGVIVTVSLWDGTKFAAGKAATPSIPKEPVTGLGDDAYFAIVGHLTSLSVKKGAVNVVFHVYGVPDQASQESIEKSLASEALANM